MTTEIKIRKSRISDIPGMIKLYSGVREIADFSNQKHEKGYFELFMKSKDKIALVADKDGEICGALNAELEDLAKYTYLNNIVVSKKHRNQGIGGMLMKELERISKKRKNKRIIALVYDWNKNMQKVMAHYNYSSGGKTVIYSKKL